MAGKFDLNGGDGSEMADESPWADEGDGVGYGSNPDVEWAKLSNDFTNAGYREGITAGKEASLQEGFDAGYAQTGAPLGRDIGLMRGTVAGLLSYVSLVSQGQDELVAEIRDISNQLANIRFSDIAPRDMEAEQHALEHLESTGEAVDENEELEGKRRMEELEDMLGSLGRGGVKRAGIEDVKRLKERLDSLCARLEVSCG
ncbi:hypothetical protein JAAARDRAFT_30106 [Jaapia argillacea MUCL 33604]|uniref:Protein YAE1 n=1 Tax=Jaapia argillacea MUCL 33604 TaxID=933084 RepID=A0A067QHW9_9AGAM|nr:hypothetical protein JAAARDRAFT_30106 [Jaapia argillacea MUCL 33604]